MKTPLLDLVPGLAAAAPIFRTPARPDGPDTADDSGDSAGSDAREPEDRQDCKPP